MALSQALYAQVLDSAFAYYSPLEWFKATAFCYFPGTENRAYAALHLPDGRIILAGHTSGAAGTDFSLARLTHDGYHDQTMGPDGQLRMDLGWSSDSCLAAALYGGDRILMGGCVAPDGPGRYVGLIVKVDLDGKIDPAFGTNGQVLLDLPAEREMVTKILPLPDGKILVAGNALNGGDHVYFSEDSRVFVGRLKPDGQVDSTFGANGFLYEKFETGCNHAVLGDLAVDPSGAVVVTAALYHPWLDWYQGEWACSQNIPLCRYLPDGAPDPAFGTNGKVSLPTFRGRGNALLVYPDGRILVAGVGGGLSSPYATYLVRCLPDGSLDKAFGNNGVLRTQTLFVNAGNAAPGNPFGMLRLSGRIVVGVLVSIFQDHTGYGALALTEEGKIDSTFGHHGKFVVNPGFSPTSYVNSITSTGPDHFFLSGYLRGMGHNLMMITKVKMPTSSPTESPVLPTVALYPNPVKRGERVTVDVSGLQHSESGFSASILDIYGRLVQAQEHQKGTAVSFDTSFMPSGTYIAVVSQDGKRWVGLCIVQ